jgi:hypothetical protein
VGVQCQQYMQSPAVKLAVGALNMIARALHLHRVFKVHVWTVAEVVLAAVELCRVESSSLVFYSRSRNQQVAGIVRRKAAELSNAPACKQLHCNLHLSSTLLNRVLERSILTKSGARKCVPPGARSGVCCPDKQVQQSLRYTRFAASPCDCIKENLSLCQLQDAVGCCNIGPV